MKFVLKIVNHMSLNAILALSCGTVKYCLVRQKKNLRYGTTGFFISHCNLNKHIYYLGIVNSSTCRDGEEETIECLFCHCLAVAQLRRIMLEEHLVNMIIVAGASSSLLC